MKGYQATAENLESANSVCDDINALLESDQDSELESEDGISPVREVNEEEEDVLAGYGSEEISETEESSEFSDISFLSLPDLES